MPHQPHPDKRAVTYRLHRDLRERLKAEAAVRGMTEVDLVSLAIEHELGRPADLCAMRKRWEHDGSV